MSSEYAIPGRLVLLPGLGLSSEVFAPQQKAFGDRLITPSWISPDRNDSLAEYAQRWADHIKPTLPAEEPIALAGYSLGGAIALDMAHALGARCVLLISAPAHPDEVPVRTLIAQRLGGLFPASFASKAAAWLALPGAQIDGLGDDDTGRLRRALSQSDGETLQWGLAALAEWRGPAHPHTLPPVHRLHGSHDWIFPCPPAGQPTPDQLGRIDSVVPDGKHVLPLSHEISVNRFLRDHCRRYLTPA